jgi:hypothetical protein
VHRATKIGAGEIESAQSLFIAFDEDRMVLQIEHSFKRANLKLIDLAGK